MPFTTKPRRQLKSLALKNAVKTYVVQPILRNYDVASVRALLTREDDFNLWEKRPELETLLDADKHIVFFVSCITALEQNSQRNEK